MRPLRRVLFYLIGQIILATGLTLSTKVNLGVSPILSIAYCASVITGRAIGDTSLIVYILCIVKVYNVCFVIMKKIPSELFPEGTFSGFPNISVQIAQRSLPEPCDHRRAGCRSSAKRSQLCK